MPPATGSAGYYEASCNAGSKVTTEARTCNVTLDVRAEPRTVCKRDSMMGTTEFDWLEWQAGYFSGAIRAEIELARQ